MKLVTIRINNRINLKLNFINGNGLSNNTFIIRGNNIGEPRELFSIKADVKYGDRQPEYLIDDIYFPGNEGEKRTDDGDRLMVFLKHRDDTETENRDRDAEREIRRRIDYFVNFDQSRNENVCKLRKPKASDCIQVEFHLKGVPEISFTFLMYFAPKVYDAIVDFGSEASQACWYKDGHKKDVHITRGIHVMATRPKKTDIDTHDDTPTDQPQDKKKPQDQDKEKKMQDILRGYVQYETDTLYKSIYYMKKDLCGIELKPWPDYNSDAIRFLVHNTEEVRNVLADYFQMPNAKLTYFDIKKYNHTTVLYNESDEPIELWQIPDGIVERILLNNIVLQTLRSIQSDPEAKKKGAYVVLNVLMPNVYPIHVVCEKLNQLARDINTLLKGVYKDNVGNNIFKSIKAVELRSVSESDASLLGYANSISSSDDALTPGTYLIMDAGKGTLDFSLMEVSSDKAYVNKSRAGIIGAGNAITYGLIIGLVNDYLSETLDDYPENPKEQADRIREFIYKKILGEKIDVAKLQKFHNVVEEYKKVYNQLYVKSVKETKAKAVTTPTPTVETTSVGSLPNSEIEPTVQTAGNESTGSDKVNIDDFNKWVESMCKSNKKLSEAGCKYVTIEIQNIAAEAIKKMGGIFDCIQKSKIKGQKHSVDTIVFTGRGFLMQEFQDVMLDYLNKADIVNHGAYAITPTANLMKTGCLNINQKLIGDKYDSSLSRQTIGLLSYINKPQDEEQNHPESDQGTDEEKSDRKVQHFVTAHRQAGGQVIESVEGNIEEGIEIKGVTGESSLSVGGWLYSIDNRFGDHNCKLFFDGNKYIITAEGVVSQEFGGEVLQTPKDPPLCFESLFPNVTISSKDEVIIPEERQEPILVQPVRRESDEVEKTKKRTVKQKSWFERICQLVRICRKRQERKKEDRKRKKDEEQIKKKKENENE